MSFRAQPHQVVGGRDSVSIPDVGNLPAGYRKYPFTETVPRRGPHRPDM